MIRLTIRGVVMVVLGHALIPGGTSVAQVAPVIDPWNPDTFPKCSSTPQPAGTERPLHPYQPGDPVCDARHLSEPRSDIPIVPPSGPRQAVTTPRPAGAPSAHAGYHYTGPNHDAYTYGFGIYTGRRVSDPTMTSGDTLYATMHMCSVNCQQWGEIGWYKFVGGARGILPTQLRFLSLSSMTGDLTTQSRPASY
jgi:hypothetical protein